MAGYFENPEATAQTIIERLAAHRRPRPLRRGRQPLHRRPQEGDDPRRVAARTSIPTSSRSCTATRRTSRRLSIVGLPGEGGQRDRRGAGRARLRGRRRIARGRARARARAHQQGQQEPAALQAGQGRPPVGPRSAEDVDAQGRSAATSIKELQRLERAAKGGAEAKQLARRRADATARGCSTCSPTCRRRSAARSRARRRLAELGFDSLMFTELARRARGGGRRACRIRRS